MYFYTPFKKYSLQNSRLNILKNVVNFTSLIISSFLLFSQWHPWFYMHLIYLHKFQNIQRFRPLPPFLKLMKVIVTNEEFFIILIHFTITVISMFFPWLGCFCHKWPEVLQRLKTISHSVTENKWQFSSICSSFIKYRNSGLLFRFWLRIKILYLVGLTLFSTGEQTGSYIPKIWQECSKNIFRWDWIYIWI